MYNDSGRFFTPAYYYAHKGEIMEKMRPMLLTTWKSYSKEQFFKDLVAGIVVAIIALPLSIALALASGVGPEQGIYTAIVAGFVPKRHGRAGYSDNPGGNHSNYYGFLPFWISD